MFIRSRSHDLSTNDFVASVSFAIAFIFLIPAFSFLTAKTQKRTLSISLEGIETKIGSQEGKILWKAVDSITMAHDKVLITGKNANAFSIPSSAFNSEEQRQQFVDLASRYHTKARQ